MSVDRLRTSDGYDGSVVRIEPEGTHHGGMPEIRLAVDDVFAGVRGREAHGSPPPER